MVISTKDMSLHGYKHIKPGDIYQDHYIDKHGHIKVKSQHIVVSVVIAKNLFKVHWDCQGLQPYYLAIVGFLILDNKDLVLLTIYDCNSLTEEYKYSNTIFHKYTIHYGMEYLYYNDGLAMKEVNDFLTTQGF